MATSTFTCFSLISLLILATTFSLSTAARTLTEDDDPAGPVVAPATGGNAAPLGAIPPNPASTSNVVPVVEGPDHTLEFFMHDILGGSNPSAKAVTGAVTNPAVNGQVPFAKPNGANLPVNNGVQQNDNNNGILNNNNLPFLTGLGGTTSALPQGNALQQFMFGTLTVIDDELTEGHELGSGLIGKAQGYYVSSSIDGKSQTMAFTVMFMHGSYIDSLSFMGVHRSAVAESQLAVMGGTGKYVNAKGHAIVKTFQGTNQNTDASSSNVVPVVEGPDHTLEFFMHDILGGSNPSAKAVTGAVTNPAVNGQVPFAKPNGANLPVNNGVQQNDNNNGILNNNNLPFLTGLGGTTSALPQGNALQQFMFGTLTVIDDELTEGHELGSGLIGKAQGYYVSSSIDGKSQTMAFTVMFMHGSYIDSLSFMGVHRSAVAESQLAVMGGTGKYVNAKGHAIVKTFQGTNQNTDGTETLLHFTVYLA
ncbi:plant disease resistance response protein [Artemisia annua]|uniref:Dirigent protein n=1 Tax=Artemisia annua TaxID=35608 RepID=A0A2U1KC56_ARTAN|nr:plant disease resistance response protein [Artemisia annua]